MHMRFVHLHAKLIDILEFYEYEENEGARRVASMLCDDIKTMSPSQPYE